MYLFNNISVWPDEALYAWKAKVIAENLKMLFSPTIIEYHPPAFSYLLSFFQYFNIDFLTGACMLNALLACLTIFLVFMSVRITTTGLIPAVLISIWSAGNILILAMVPRCMPDILQLACFAALHFLMLQTMHRNRISAPRSLFAIGLVASFCLTVKWSGVLIFPILCLLMVLNRKQLSPRPVLALILPPALTMIFLLLLNKTAFGTVYPYLAPLYGNLSQGPWWVYLASLAELSGFPLSAVIILLVLGIFQAIQTRKPEQLFCLYSFLILLGCISWAGEKQLRYAMILIPSLLTIMGPGFSLFLCWSKENIIRKAILIIFILHVSAAIFLNALQILPQLHASSQSYTGFDAAGKWLRENTSGNSIIYTGSRRQIRYFSGIDFVENGGRISSVRMPKEHFHPIRSSTTDSFLVVDKWEFYNQPDWLFPFNAQKKHALGNLGFKLVHEIKKKTCPSQQKTCPQSTVIWIFHYEPNASSLPASPKAETEAS